jgi:hypothetical protein
MPNDTETHPCPDCGCGISFATDFDGLVECRTCKAGWWVTRDHVTKEFREFEELPF